VASINQTGSGIRLPNFCNLGVMLHALAVANLFVLAAAVMRARQASEIAGQLMVGAAFAEPILIVSLILLCAARRGLHALRYPVAITLVVIAEVALALGWSAFLGDIVPDEAPTSGARVAFFAVFVTGALLAYFDLRARALAPAIAEAKIQALQARIRPHFLYNSINAVLSLIRSEPKRAEQALADLADLFRILMGDNRALTPLSKEIGIARQYLAIEQLRMGERLRVTWNIGEMPADALVPALLLQPLVENAVYHGIEPLEAGGEISIEVRSSREELRIRLTNPYSADADRHSGNRMALANIRERLQLHFDAEASMQSREKGDAYEVTITLPYIPAPP
jgi:two-component system sensor histidine kinase AlgZ